MAGDVAQQDAPRARQVAAWAGPRWLWFGVLGGPVAWAVHLIVAWSVVELACGQAWGRVLGVPLRLFAGLATTVPGLVAVAATVVALRALRALRRGQQAPPDGVEPRRLARAAFMAEVGAWSGGLTVMMIVFGGAAVLTLPACSR